MKESHPSYQSLIRSTVKRDGRLEMYVKTITNLLTHAQFGLRPTNPLSLETLESMISVIVKDNLGYENLTRKQGWHSTEVCVWNE